MLGRKLLAFLGHVPRTFNAQRRLYTQLSSPVEVSKRSSRGGHGRNLSERFRQLEKMVLAKHNLSQTIMHKPRVSQQPTLSLSTTLPRRPTPMTFRGIVIPEIPRPPEPDECCMSGCAVCVHDLYQESLDAHKSAVAAVRVSLTSMGVPMEQWPKNIRLDSEGKTTASISLSAFEELERELKARRNAEAQS
ncbi:oxidoreductase-like protein [Lactarius hatsudake]|nr:oxidoreductase-like protein [Lactarius hatsudake]